jgi:hypothetical protein
MDAIAAREERLSAVAVLGGDARNERGGAAAVAGQDPDNPASANFLADGEQLALQAGIVRVV